MSFKNYHNYLFSYLDKINKQNREKSHFILKISCALNELLTSCKYLTIVLSFFA